MPIEIKELHIKVTVNAPGGAQGLASAAPAPPTDSPQPNTDKEAMVAECVEQVLQILQARKER